MLGAVEEGEDVRLGFAPMGEEPRDERRLGSAGARVEAAIEGDDEEFDFGQDGENLAAECRLVIARGGGGVDVVGSVSGFGHPGSFILRLAACAGRRVRRVPRGAGSGTDLAHLQRTVAEFDVTLLGDAFAGAACCSIGGSGAATAVRSGADLEDGCHSSSASSSTRRLR